MHVMLDLETLSSANNAAIASIGACLFDHSGVGKRFYRCVDIKSSQDAGLHIDADTLKWWFAQSHEARVAAFGLDSGGAQQPVDSLNQVLWELSQFVTRDLLHSANPKQRIYLWGNGATFDNVVLRNAYTAAKCKPFWHYSGDRCYRTIINMFPPSNAPTFQGVKHVALDDAVWQARRLVAAAEQYKFALEAA